jgi:ATP-dependent Zn protease
MSEDEVSQRETAYHEAGHVVADYAQHFYLGDASIRPGEGRLGHAAGEGAWSDGSRDEEAIISLFAGLAAARLVRPGLGVMEGGASDDYEKAANLLQRVEPSQAALEARAAELIGKNRPTVDAVAQLLLEEETVCADDLETVCCAVEEGENWREMLELFRRRRHVLGG